GDGGVADGDGAAVGGVESGQAVHERRLARARGAHDGGELAGVELDGDVAERDDLRLTDTIGPPQFGGGHGRTGEGRGWGIREWHGIAFPGQCSLRMATRLWTGGCGGFGPRAGLRLIPEVEPSPGNRPNCRGGSSRVDRREGEGAAPWRRPLILVSLQE